MPVLQLGLAFAGVAFLYVSWASWEAGYGPDVAVLRGLIAFMAVSLIGYIGELIIATARPLPSGRRRRRTHRRTLRRTASRPR